MKKTSKYLYAPSAKASAIVDVPPMTFLMFDGTGDPNTAPDYVVAIEALYTLTYTLKFALKREGLDYPVMPLEGLWWAEDMTQFRLDARTNWRWTMMIAQPAAVADADVAAAYTVATKKLPPATRTRVRREVYHEGLSAQVLHLGPYAAEAPTIDALHAFIAAQGYVRAGKHHEIYLNDPRKTAPEKLQTVIRQPIAPSANVP
ncbi:MAG: GyrI-like domain-containing protein [Chloroflexales bacterium]